MKTYTFVEPHVTGGFSTVEITETQILKHMKAFTPKLLTTIKQTDQQLIDEFIVVNWCMEKK